MRKCQLLWTSSCERTTLLRMTDSTGGGYRQKGDSSTPSGSSPRASPRFRPPPVPSPPLDPQEALAEASSLLGDTLRPDSSSLDPLITALYLKLATSSRDDDIRLRAAHDLADMRGYFARAHAKAAAGGRALEAAITLRPDIFSKLVTGLSDMSIVDVSVANELKALQED